MAKQLRKKQKLTLGKRERASIEAFIRDEFNEEPIERYVQEWAHYFRVLNDWAPGLVSKRTYIKGADTTKHLAIGLAKSRPLCNAPTSGPKRITKNQLTTVRTRVTCKRCLTLVTK